MTENRHKVALFGELLMRLETPRQLRFVQAHQFDVGYTGGEANAGVLLARWGLDAALVSAVPDNDIGLACTNQMQQYGLDVRHVQRRGARLGLFFLEMGAAHRPTRVLYDRQGSAFAELKPGEIPWQSVLAGVDWLHFTGTAPALSPALAELTREGCRAANELGVTVSCDLNYRSALWSMAAARETMPAIVQHVDVLIANEEHARDILGASTPASRVADRFEPARYQPLMQELRRTFDLRAVALTVRSGDSNDETHIAAVLDDDGRLCGSKKYSIRPLDRIGGGDAFAGALIYALLQRRAPQDAVELAAAASCLKHAVRGDFCHASLEETESLVREGSDGRVRR